MTVRTIKNVDDETWKTLKELAGRRKLKMGYVLKYAVRDYAKKSEKISGSLIPSKPLLTDREAEAMLKMVRKMRKESGFRNATDF